MLTTLLTIFVSSFVIALSGALMPGPLLTATISESSQRGFITGPLMIAGHAILELVTRHRPFAGSGAISPATGRFCRDRPCRIRYSLLDGLRDVSFVALIASVLGVRPKAEGIIRC